MKLHTSLDLKQITIKQHRAATEEINDLLKGIAKRNDASLLDAEYLFCDNTMCNFADENRIPYFKDYTHMRSSFVRDHYVLLDELILEK